MNDATLTKKLKYGATIADMVFSAVGMVFAITLKSSAGLQTGDWPAMAITFELLHYHAYWFCGVTHEINFTFILENFTNFSIYKCKNLESKQSYMYYAPYHYIKERWHMMLLQEHVICVICYQEKRKRVKHKKEKKKIDRLNVGYLLVG